MAANAVSWLTILLLTTVTGLGEVDLAGLARHRTVSSGRFGLGRPDYTSVYLTYRARAYLSLASRFGKTAGTIGTDERYSCRAAQVSVRARRLAAMHVRECRMVAAAARQDGHEYSAGTWTEGQEFYLHLHLHLDLDFRNQNRSALHAAGGGRWKSPLS